MDTPEIPRSMFLKEPVKIDPRWDDADPFPIWAMGELANPCLCVSRQTCMPPSSVAMSVLTAASALTSWWVRVDTVGWGIQPGNLYTTIAAWPGAGKGGLFAAAVTPVTEMLREKTKELTLAQEHSKWQIKQLEDEVAKEEVESVAKALNRRIAELRTQQGKCKLVSGTATSAGIGGSLERNGAAYASFSDEASASVQVILGLHTGGQSDTKMWLAGFRGESADNDVGVGGNSCDTPNFLMSVLWVFTPSSVEKLLSNPEVVANGAISRATMIQYPRMKQQELIEPLAGEETEIMRIRSYYKAIEKFRYTFEEPLQDDGGKEIWHPAPTNKYYPDGLRKSRDPHIVPLSPGAFRRFKKEQERIAAIVNNTSDTLVNFVVRLSVPLTHIALQLHMIKSRKEVAAGTIAETSISEQTMAEAIAINAWLVEHQRKNLGLVQNAADSKDGERVVGYISKWERSDKTPCPVREVIRGYGIKAPQALDILQRVERAGYISIWSRQIGNRADRQVLIATAKSQMEAALQRQSEEASPKVTRWVPKEAGK